MARKAVLLPNGETHAAVIHGYETDAEPWAQVLLDDGTVLRVRLIVTEVLEVEQPDARLLAEGEDRLFIIRHQPIVVVVPRP